MSNKEEVKEFDSFADEVWDTLTRIDVTKHTDNLPATKKRPEISYLPWHSAWMLLKRKFPASTFEYEQDLHHPDGTVEVGVFLSVRKSRSMGMENQQDSYCRLAVMDSWMNPVAKPTSREVNDSRQRCLVKAMAFAGLGLTLWTGDSIPIGVMEDKIDDDQLHIITNLVEQSDTNEESFRKWADNIEALSDMTQERFPSALALLKQKAARKAKESKS